MPAETIDHVIAVTNQAPPYEATHWDRAGDGQGGGVSPSSVRCIRKRHGLQPHRMRSFKLSDDPKFAEKLKEVVGLYIYPPADGVVLGPEKSQIQALEIAPSPVCR